MTEVTPCPAPTAESFATLVTTVTLTEAQANLVRSALAERWFDQAKNTAEDVSAALGGGPVVSIRDAAWKVHEMSTVVGLFEKLGWPEARTI